MDKKNKLEQYTYINIREYGEKGSEREKPFGIWFVKKEQET